MALVQMVKNLPAMTKAPGSGRALEQGVAARPGVVAWRVPVHRGAWRAAVHGVSGSGTPERRHTSWLHFRDLISPS